MTWEEWCQRFKEDENDVQPTTFSGFNWASVTKGHRAFAKSFADELVKRTTVPSNVINAIQAMLHEAGVPQ